MPQVIDGKPLTEKEHRQWRHVYESMLPKVGKERAAAAATAEVQKARQETKHAATEVHPFARCPHCGSTAIAVDAYGSHCSDLLRCSQCHSTFHTLEAMPKLVGE